MSASALKRVRLRNFQLIPDRAEKYAGRPVRIWSGEHRAYWRSNYAGYTTHRVAAGRYLFQDALAYTRSCGPEKCIWFEFIEEGDTGEPARHIGAWHEDDGPVLWWVLPVAEPPWVGTPLDDSWPGYHKYWTPLPPIPHRPKRRKAAA